MSPYIWKINNIPGYGSMCMYILTWAQLSLKFDNSFELHVHFKMCLHVFSGRTCIHIYNVYIPLGKGNQRIPFKNVQ